MPQTIKIDQAGRIVLPSEVRRRLNLGPGARLNLEVIAERIELTPQPPQPPALLRKGKRLVLAATGKPFDAAAAIREERELQARRNSRR